MSHNVRHDVRRTLQSFLLIVLFSAATLNAEEGKIPLLISDHHADHAGFLLRRFGFSEDHRSLMIVLDAHSDTVINEDYQNIRNMAAEGRYAAADNLFHNQDWIHPLMPFPVDSLIWIHSLSGFPDMGRLQGFYSSGIFRPENFRQEDFLMVPATQKIHPNIQALSLDKLGTFEPHYGESLLSGESTLSAEKALFISIDLDFFCTGYQTPEDIPFVLDTLLDFTSQWKGPRFWAFCLSRLWLPSDEYAWELLRQCLFWLQGKTEFEEPELTVFSSYRFCTSNRAAAFREMGWEIPGLYSAQDTMPDDIRELLLKK
jgi:hypothetical protein